MGAGRKNTPSDERSKWENGGCHDSSCLDAKKSLPIKEANAQHLYNTSMKLAEKHGFKPGKPHKDGRVGYKGNETIDAPYEKALKVMGKTARKANGR